MGAHTKQSLLGLRIGVLGRGGAGKSTITVLLARALRSAGYQVVVLDADSTNVGLGRALGAQGRPRQLIDYFGGTVFAGGPVTCPVDDPTPLAGSTIGANRVPEDLFLYSPEGIRIFEAGKVTDRGTGAGCDGPIGKIARDLQVRQGHRRPVMVVDFKAGFEDAARGVITGLNWILVVVDPSLAAVRMAVDAKHTVEYIRAGSLPATKHLEDAALIEVAHDAFRNAAIRSFKCILNKIPDAPTEHLLRQKLAIAGIEPLGVIRQSPPIADAWLKGEPLPAGRSARVANEIVRRLELAEVQSMTFVSRDESEFEQGGSEDGSDDTNSKRSHDTPRERSERLSLHR